MDDDFSITLGTSLRFLTRPKRRDAVYADFRVKWQNCGRTWELV
jgi:hypothetical protein